MTLRVVVADDEPLAAAVLVRELERLGCEVVASTGTGRLAIQACMTHVPDACFTDISMPDRDGLRWRRRCGRRLPASPWCS